MQILILLGIFVVTSTAQAEPPTQLVPTPKDRAAQLRGDRWIDTLAREIAPLANIDPARLPMVMWHGVGFEPLSRAEHAILKQRGLCQHIQLHESMIPTALALQAAKMPVIVMEGRTDAWPYSLSGDKQNWAHDFDADYEPPWKREKDAFAWHGACPMQTAGWIRLAEQTKATLTKFRLAGVRVDAIWMDYEGDPYPWKHLFEQVSRCRRCRKQLDPEVVTNEDAWWRYSWQQYVSLYDENFAKPIREVYPECIVTNWHVVFSTQAHPVRYFVRDRKLPPLAPTHFNASNPIAYASDVVWNEVGPKSPEVTRAQVDAFYTSQILHQVQSDALNRKQLARQTETVSVPWVARVCRMTGDEPAPPIMSRESYRQALAQLWREGIATMQVFNGMHEGYEELAITELKDAVLAYDASMAVRRNR